jgi:hypothetical protein
MYQHNFNFNNLNTRFMRIIYTISFLLVASLLFLGNSNGPGEIQGQDRTGGPVANGFCGVCHAAGAFNPTMTLEVLEGDNPVTVYQPGSTYTMRVTVNADAGAAVYGFQAVALLNGNLQAGSFTAGMGTQVTPLNNREYIEHSEASTDNVFEVEWTAPANTAGDVSFYASAMAGNDNGSSGGDGAAFLTSPVVLSDGAVSTQALPALASSLSVYPNPVGNELNIQLELEENTLASVRIYNQFGQQLTQYQERLNQGKNQLIYDVSELPGGQYVLEISNGDKASVSMLVKQ